MTNKPSTIVKIDNSQDKYVLNCIRETKEHTTIGILHNATSNTYQSFGYLEYLTYSICRPFV